MLLLRLLFLLLLAFIAWRAWRLFIAPGPKPEPPPLQDMVRCEFCDVHVPAASAVRDAGHAFCGEAHRQAYLSRREPR